MSQISELFAAGYDERREEEIVKLFWETARRIARFRLSPEARQQAESEDIASMALKSALSSLAAGRKTVTDGDEFMRYLALKIRDKVNEAGRKAIRGKRDPRRESNDENALDSASGEPDPTLAETVLRELANRVDRYFENENDPIKRAINELYFFVGLSGEILHKELERRFGSQGLISERTLYRHLAAVKSELKALLDEE